MPVNIKDAARLRSQRNDGSTPAQRFADFSKRILSVPKAEIDR